MMPTTGPPVPIGTGGPYTPPLSRGRKERGREEESEDVDTPDEHTRHQHTGRELHIYILG